MAPHVSNLSLLHPPHSSPRHSLKHLEGAHCAGVQRCVCGSKGIMQVARRFCPGAEEPEGWRRVRRRRRSGRHHPPTGVEEDNHVVDSQGLRVIPLGGKQVESKLYDIREKLNKVVGCTDEARSWRRRALSAALFLCTWSARGPESRERSRAR